MDGINSKQIDIICELGNIGAGNAATALSGMLGEKVEMSLPKVEIVPLADIPSMSGSPDTLVVGGVVDMSGDITGHIMMILGMKEACNMASVICGDTRVAGEASPSSLTELGMSAVGEVMNILAGSYLSAISTLSGLVILPSIPYVCADMVGSVLSIVAIECGEAGDSALFFRTSFSNVQDSIACDFSFFPTASPIKTHGESGSC